MNASDLLRPFDILFVQIIFFVAVFYFILIDPYFDWNIRKRSFRARVVSF
jgi:hypothetical protein